MQRLFTGNQAERDHWGKKGTKRWKLEAEQKRKEVSQARSGKEPGARASRRSQPPPGLKQAQVFLCLRRNVVSPAREYEVRGKQLPGPQAHQPASRLTSPRRPLAPTWPAFLWPHSVTWKKETLSEQRSSTVPAPRPLPALLLLLLLLPGPAQGEPLRLSFVVAPSFPLRAAFSAFCSSVPRWRLWRLSGCHLRQPRSFPGASICPFPAS